MSVSSTPKGFISRRFHSLLGFWLVIYLIMHLLTNSQAALLIGNDGYGFIKSVNSIHELPYLPLLEILVIAVPIILHAWWGIQYLRTSKMNDKKTDGSSPSLPEYSRNKAYSWQRITSWLLVVGILAHVIHMRFVEYPSSAHRGSESEYFVRLNDDAGLATLANRLNVTIFTQADIDKLKTEKESIDTSLPQSVQEQDKHMRKTWLEAIEKRPLAEGQVIAGSKDFGTAELLMVRDTFKNPMLMILYSLLVIFACYHAFNGLWTFMIKWGVNLSYQTQQSFLYFTNGLTLLFIILGLTTIWGTYWINLKY